MPSARLGLPRAAALLAASTILWADGVQTGTLEGVVRGSGTPLQQARVTLEGPGLLKPRTVASGTSGAFVVPLVPPGAYTLTVTAEGFEPARVQAVVRLDQATRIHLNLAAKAAAVVEATAQIAALDTTRVASQADTPKALLDRLPVAHDVGGAMALLPGVVAGGWNPRLGGGTINGNVYLVDGVDTTDSSSGRAGMTLAQDAIEVVQVLTSGLGAEYGRFSGGVVNVLTKSGSNTFEGSLRATVNNLAWNATGPSFNGQSNRPESRLNTVFYATVGGPILKDRLWFFLTGETTRQSIRQTVVGLGGTSPRVPYLGRLERDRFSAKLTYALSTDHTLILQHTADPGRMPLDLSRAGDVSALTTQEDGGRFTSLTYRGILGSATVLEAKLARHGIPFAWRGSDEGRMSWWNLALNQMTAFENPRFVGFSDRKRNQMSLAVTHLFDGMGRHEFKAGLDHQASRIRERITLAGDGFVFFNGFNPVTGGAEDLTARFGLKHNYNLAGAMAQVFNPMPEGRSVQEVTAGYVTDKWTRADRVTVEVGLRSETWRGEDHRGQEAWDYTSWSPRLGASWDPRGDGRSAVFMSYGVYVQNPVQDGLTNPTTFLPAARGFAMMVWGGTQDPRVKSSWIPHPVLPPVSASGRVGFDPDLKGFRVRETVLGYRLATPGGSSLEARWIHRRFSDPVDHRVYYDSTGTLVSLLQNARTARKLYRGLLLTGETQWGAWHFMANAALARLEGNQDQHGMDSPYDNYTQGSWVPPINRNNASYGTLEGDRRNVIKAMAVHQGAWGRWELESGLIGTHVGGAAFSRSTNVVMPDPKGNPVLFQQIEGARGSHRFPAYTALDGSVTASLTLSGRRKAFIRADVFNVLNRVRQIAWDVMDTQLPTYGQATSPIHFTAPRMLMLTVGVAF